MKRRVLSILILGANLLNVAAQNMTSSPVSMFGLGELSTGEGGIYSGLGGVGIALRGENVINDANPASLTGLLPQYFFFDLGVSGSYLKYSQSGASNHSLTLMRSRNQPSPSFSGNEMRMPSRLSGAMFQLCAFA